jgi:hypothetical protein
MDACACASAGIAMKQVSTTAALQKRGIDVLLQETGDFVRRAGWTGPPAADCAFKAVVIANQVLLDPRVPFSVFSTTHGRGAVF